MSTVEWEFELGKGEMVRRGTLSVVAFGGGDGDAGIPEGRPGISDVSPPPLCGISMLSV